MKKSISITINNIVFQIDENAYEKLDAYLKSIEKHYGSSKEGKEIFTDIESSITEKFLKKISSKKQSINLTEVEKIIKIMGTVEEFSQEAEEISQNREEKSSKKKESEKTRRLYRDSDDTVISGVCSGLAAYFGIDSVIVRIIFILLTFVKGIGLIVYLVLFFIVPKAKNSSQKLAMKGKPINLKKIEETVKEKSKMLKKEGKEALGSLNNKRGVLYKIINFPIKVTGYVFSFIIKISSKIWPLFSIFFGVIFITIVFFLILALIITTGIVIFNIDSPYLISDIPLESITSSDLYSIGIISICFIILIPFVFLLMLGLSMIRRKNCFKLIFSSFLIGLWIIAITVGAVIAIDLMPEIRSKVITTMEQEVETRDYDHKDFYKLYLGANIRGDIKQGDEFSITMEGRKQDLDRLSFEIKDGQLQIVQGSREKDGKLCFICFDKKISVEITMPKLESLVSFRDADIKVSDFKEDIYISLGESAKLDIELEGQNVSCKLSGVSSKLNLSGQIDNLDCQLDGHAKLTTKDNFKAENINLVQSVLSRVTLKGEVDKFLVELDNYSKLYASDLKAQEVAINTESSSRAEVYPIQLLKAVANDQSRITYKGSPIEVISEENKQGKIIKNEYFELD